MRKLIVDEKPLLSICIPTNGVIEWVRPVLKSIYEQNVSLDLYEVIITCNGNNVEFDNYINSLMRSYDNLVYKKTQEKGFLNQIFCFKQAKGVFIKFLNHRMIMINGSVEYLICFIKKNNDKKTPVYFSNGSLGTNGIERVKNFDEYIGRLGIYSSWSGGLAFWRDEWEDGCEIIEYNKLFPHFKILCNNTSAQSYIIDDNVLMNEITNDCSKKGKYNFFYAFAVEYLFLILELYKNKKISLDTVINIKRKVKDYLADQYINFIIFRKRTSYDLSGRCYAFSVFFNMVEIYWAVAKRMSERPFIKILKVLKWRVQ